jgi:hypothetical protein
MRGILLLLFVILSSMDLNSQSKSTDRQPVAAGRFYAADKTALTSDIAALFAECKKTEIQGKVRALIVPHAGYVFSGKTAATGYASTKREEEYKNIFIIGSSHVMAFEGASVYYSGDYMTPFGKAVVNKEIANKLRNGSNVFRFPVTAHNDDHNIEVQIPLIQYYYKTIPALVPIIIGTNNTETIKAIASALKPWFTDENLFIFSSDFSHYPAYEDAKATDKATAEALLTGDPDYFLTVLKKNSGKNIPGLATSMCGWTAGLTLLYLTANDPAFKYHHLEYCNSGDSPYGSKDQVVGYHSIAVTSSEGKDMTRSDSGTELKFSPGEKEILFKIARNSILARLNGTSGQPEEAGKLPENLKKQFGVFVTLKIDGVLRGCIGRFYSDDPLYKLVSQSALSSAFEDPRFPPLTREEYDKLNFEITVLGPMKKIHDINEIVLGKHGIYIRSKDRAGTMLPQVATENKWTVEQFLGYTAMNKAGLGWEGWKDAEIFIYEGLVLEENEE